VTDLRGRPGSVGWPDPGSLGLARSRQLVAARGPDLTTPGRTSSERSAWVDMHHYGA